MNAQQLKNSILQEAIEGRLVPQDPNDEPASVLLERIRKEKKRLVKEGKLKKKDLEERPISKDEIPFEIPESWEWVRASDVVNVIMGQSPDGNDVYEAKEDSKAYEFHQGKISFTEKYIASSGKWCKNPSRIANVNTLLVCVRAPIGDVNITLRQIGIGRGLAAMEGFGGIQTLFLFFWVLAHKRCLVDKGTGSTFKAITVDVLRKQPFPLPPLAEQHRIVAKIEELLPEVEEYGKGQETLDKLNAELPEQLKKSILQEAIEGRLVPQDPNDEPASVLLDKIRKEKKRLVKEGKLKKKDIEERPINKEVIPFDVPKSWEWASLSMLSLDSADGPFGSNLKKEHYTDNKEVRIIQLSNIGEDGWKDGNKKYTTFKHLKSISRSEAFANDIIIAKMMPAGRAIICPNWDAKYVLSSDAVRFDFYVEINRKYLYYAINSHVFRSQVYDNVQGITRVRTSLSKLRNYLIPLPPLAEQHRIVSKIEQLLQEINKLKE